MAVVGGTASVLGGGKFGNGALAGAFMQMFNAERFYKKVGKYFVSKPEQHPGSQKHIHWGESANKGKNAINVDGTIRHGEDLPGRVRKFIKNVYKIKIPNIPIIVPTQVYENFYYKINMTVEELKRSTLL